MVGVRKRMTCSRVLHAEQGDNVACLSRVELLARVGVHFNDTTNPLSLARKCVQEVVALLKRPRIDPCKR